MLGIQLFDRTTRRVELTQGGREFQSAAVRITQDLDLAIADAKAVAERKRGRVVIAAPPFLAAAILPSAIAKTRAEYPGLHVGIVDAGTGAILESVGRERRSGAWYLPATEDDLVRSKLVRDRLMLFCSAAHRLARRQNVRWRDLKDEPLITLTRDSGIRILVELGYEAANVPLRADYQVTQISTALALAGAGRDVRGVRLCSGCGLASTAPFISQGRLYPATSSSCAPAVDPCLQQRLPLLSAYVRSFGTRTFSSESLNFPVIGRNRHRSPLAAVRQPNRLLWPCLT